MDLTSKESWNCRWCCRHNWVSWTGAESWDTFIAHTCRHPLVSLAGGVVGMPSSHFRGQ